MPSEGIFGFEEEPQDGIVFVATKVNCVSTHGLGILCRQEAPLAQRTIRMTARGGKRDGGERRRGKFSTPTRPYWTRLVLTGEREENIASNLTIGIPVESSQVFLQSTLYRPLGILSTGSYRRRNKIGCSILDHPPFAWSGCVDCLDDLKFVLLGTVPTNLLLHSTTRSIHLHPGPPFPTYILCRYIISTYSEYLYGSIRSPFPSLPFPFPFDYSFCNSGIMLAVSIRPCAWVCGTPY